MLIVSRCAIGNSVKIRTSFRPGGEIFPNRLRLNFPLLRYAGISHGASLRVHSILFLILLFFRVFHENLFTNGIGSVEVHFLRLPPTAENGVDRE